jgi:hypothetical protein
MANIKVPRPALYDDPDYPQFKRVFFIEKREFKRCKGDKERDWYYSGTLYEIDPTQGDPPFIRYATTIINVPEKYIKPIPSPF